MKLIYIKLATIIINTSLNLPRVGFVIYSILFFFYLHNGNKKKQRPL